ncbi:MAG: lipopolysaccharide transport system ATP-binding protein [Gaiellaceae bacterium]|jgi:ABC-type polysaccharide/polyol phosphate transport system ATPase subunit|nr:lipopolysaccharide transport system ATP-binding protein [Gaiellaceae bacterium]
MTPGEIRVEHVARRFRVYPQEARTLKDLVVARRRVRGRDIDALRDVSFAVEPGAAVGLVGRNGSGKTTLLRILSGIIKPSSGSAEVGGRVGALLELGAGFHPDFSGEENVYLNGAIHGLSRRQVREHLDEIVHFAELEDFIRQPVRTYSSGMVMRLGFAIAAHVDPDVLLLDEVFAVGDEEFQRKCFGRIFEFKQRGGTIVFVSHDAASVERLCDRAILLRGGSVAFDGPAHEAIVEYRRLLADERDPAERSAGLREWGSGEIRVAGVRLLDGEGDERSQFSPGEALSLRIDVACERPVPAPPRLSLELRDAGGVLLAGTTRDLGELGWEPGGEHLGIRFDVDHLPLADGRFTVRLGLVDARGEHLYHQLDEAVSFLVYPGAGERGVLRLEGRWAREEIETATPTVPG